jgi:hypothetical protein
MDPRIINAILLILGFALFITGITRVMAEPGIWDYVLMIVGILLIILSIVGFRRGRVF